MPRNLLHTSAIVDHRGVIASPGAILLEGDTIIMAGTPQEIGHPENTCITQIDKIVTPSFVNTHAHLDLSGVGIVPPCRSFFSWVEEVVLPIRQETHSIQASVSRGIELLSKGGSSIVGDISGTQEAAELVQDSPLNATTFIEFFGVGKRQNACVEQIRQLPEQFGIEPHSPYSCGLEVFKEAFSSGRAIATHLAETLEEVEYSKNRSGSMVEFLQRMGAWVEDEDAWGRHPVDVVLDLAGDIPCIAAHLNYIEDAHLKRLAESQMTVAYCPRASEYFGHRGHRWQEMIDAGVRVSIGTDSLLCLDTPDRISVIDELRFLYQRDYPDPLQLLAMGTIHGAAGLGLAQDLVTLNVGDTAGLLAFEVLGRSPLLDIFESKEMPKWVHSLI
tara:strand:- start:2494 stop:3657 length:1164 start_codon:yes stop_codon:yes gene_type:complete